MGIRTLKMLMVRRWRAGCRQPGGEGSRPKGEKVAVVAAGLAERKEDTGCLHTVLAVGEAGEVAEAREVGRSWSPTSMSPRHCTVLPDLQGCACAVGAPGRDDDVQTGPKMPSHHPKFSLLQISGFC